MSPWPVRLDLDVEFCCLRSFEWFASWGTQHLISLDLIKAEYLKNKIAMVEITIQENFGKLRCHCLEKFKLIYFTLITQKAHRTYKHVIKGEDAGVLWSYMVEGIGVHGGNHRRWTGNYYPATCQDQESIPGSSGNKRGCHPCVIQTLTVINNLLSESKTSQEYCKTPKN